MLEGKARGEPLKWWEKRRKFKPSEPAEDDFRTLSNQTRPVFGPPSEVRLRFSLLEDVVFYSKKYKILFLPGMNE